MSEYENDEQFYRDTESIAFPKLDDRQISQLDPLGQRRKLRRGEILFKAGQRDLGLTVVISGELEAFENRDGKELILATPGPRDFVGDVSVLTGNASLASVRGQGGGVGSSCRRRRRIKKGPLRTSGLGRNHRQRPDHAPQAGCSGTANSRAFALWRWLIVVRGISSTIFWTRITFFIA